MQISTDSGALGLIAIANKSSTYKGAKYCFRGDLIQMARAREIAIMLEKETDTDGGIPFVKSKEDFEEVKQYIISYKIEGWWNYVSREEYLKMK